MNKEGVALQIGENVSGKRRAWILERNGNIARDLANHMQIDYIGEANLSQLERGNLYVVPATTLGGEAALWGIESAMDLYGVKVEDFSQVGKAMMHPTADLLVPGFHSDRFAERVRGFVLPGVTGFSTESLLDAYSDMKHEYSLRLKLPNESDGDGQYPLIDATQLQSVLAKYDEDFIRTNGMVLEANVENHPETGERPRTISAGFLQVGDERYSFLAFQKDAIVSEFDPKLDARIEKTRYGGAKVYVIKGGMENLFRLPIYDPRQIDALESTIGFHNAYAELIQPIASRLSFDYLYGVDKQGKFLGGVTDITGRLGGTCPALMQALEIFRADSSVSSVCADVTLNYSPHILLPEEINSRVYMNAELLRISAKVIQVNGEVFRRN